MLRCGAACGAGAQGVRVPPAAGCLRGTGGSLRAQDDAKWLTLARQFVLIAKSARAHSDVLRSLPHLHGEGLNFLSGNRAAGALSRLLSAWKRLCNFCRVLNVDNRRFLKLVCWILRKP